MNCKCYLCGHKWNETRYRHYRCCPGCNITVDIPACKAEFGLEMAAQAFSAPAPPPRPPVVIEPQDHSYLGHNPWLEIAENCKRKGIRLWPDFGAPIKRRKK